MLSSVQIAGPGCRFNTKTIALSCDKLTTGTTVQIHHSAFDAHLIGIDPDYRLHVSVRLMEKTDGPMLEALKRLHGGTIHLPSRRQDMPDRERLAVRFELFQKLSNENSLVLPLRNGHGENQKSLYGGGLNDASWTK